MSPLRWLVLAMGSAIALWPSRRSLRDPGAHGFYRFFAFEAIVALIALNLPYWFRKPLSPRQLVSWPLLAGSAGLAVHGFRLLRVIGRPAGDFEQTTRLVRQGAYRVIRHPLYASLLLLAWGAYLKKPSAAGAALAAGASAALAATAKVEERENLARFGDEYARYMQETRMFVPGLF